MSQGAIISGFVAWNGKTQPPVDKRTIVVRAPMKDGSLSGDAVTGNVQPDDTFALNGVLVGYHYIRVEGLPPPWVLSSVEMNGADITDTAVNFEYGQVVRGMRVIFSDTSSEIFGTIRVASGDVIQGYAVVAFATNPALWYPRSRYTALARPDERGRYRIRGLPGAEYDVIVTRDVDEGDVGNAEILDQLSRTAGVRRLLIKDGERLSLNLRALRRPLPGASGTP